MDSNVEKLKRLIDVSDLDPADKENMWQVFSGAQDSDLEAMVGLLMEDSSWFEKINRNIKAKQHAFQNGDNRKWTDAIEEEKGWIAEMI